MKKLPEFIIVQIEDVDGDVVYYSANEKDTPYPPSDNHPTAVYRLQSPC
jgi:hypothetical protein